MGFKKFYYYRKLLEEFDPESLDSFYRTVQVDGSPVAILKNPSLSELRQVPSFREYGEFKIFADKSDIYVFDGTSVLHRDVAFYDENLKNMLPLSVRFDMNFGGIEVTRSGDWPNSKYTDSMKTMIKNHSVLNSLFKKIAIVFGT